MCASCVESSGKLSGGYVLDGRSAFRGRREACRGTIPSFLNSSFAFFERLLNHAYKLYYRLLGSFHDIVCDIIFYSVLVTVKSFTYLLRSSIYELFRYMHLHYESSFSTSCHHIGSGAFTSMPSLDMRSDEAWRKKRSFSSLRLDSSDIFAMASGSSSVRRFRLSQYMISRKRGLDKPSAA